MKLFRLVSASVFVGGLVLSAQDGSMVLRTSVGYRTQRNSLTLTDEQKQQADQLAREADQANRAGKYGDAIRAYYHGMAVMHNSPWTPAIELASSLQGKVDHAVAAPGETVTVSLSPLYQTAADGIKMTALVALVPPRSSGGSEKVIASDVPVNLPFSTKVTLPADASGDYTLELRLQPAAVVRAVPMHVEALAAQAAKLRTRLAKAGQKTGAAYFTAAYALDFYERVDRGEASPVNRHFHDEFARAEELLDAIEGGKDPFAGKHGDLHKAYLSNVDHTLQPYRMLVPEVYNGKASALVVALHGMGGDENSMFDAYNRALKPALEKAGFLAVCPKGRDSASMYRGSAEQDVMDVLAEVRRDYNVDPNRIYLMGHSMGGFGTWSVAMAHPDVFAALGPISGGGSADGMAKIARIPEYVTHGDADPTVPVASSRTMVAAGKKAGANIVYVEVPGGNHMSVVAGAFEPMMEFFAKQKKSD